MACKSPETINQNLGQDLTPPPNLSETISPVLLHAQNSIIWENKHGGITSSGAFPILDACRGEQTMSFSAADKRDGAAGDRGSQGEDASAFFECNICIDTAKVCIELPLDATFTK